MGKKKKKKQKKMGVSKISAYLIALVLDIVVGGLWYYTAFPALNIHNYEFWLILLVLITVDTFLIALLQYDFMERETIKPKKVLRSIGSCFDWYVSGMEVISCKGLCLFAENRGTKFCRRY